MPKINSLFKTRKSLEFKNEEKNSNSRRKINSPYNFSEGRTNGHRTRKSSISGGRKQKTPNPSSNNNNHSQNNHLQNNHLQNNHLQNNHLNESKPIKSDRLQTNQSNQGKLSQSQQGKLSQSQQGKLSQSQQGKLS